VEPDALKYASRYSPRSCVYLVNAFSDGLTPRLFAALQHIFVGSIRTFFFIDVWHCAVLTHEAKPQRVSTWTRALFAAVSLH
jgi:hypothetical protein